MSDLEREIEILEEKLGWISTYNNPENNFSQGLYEVILVLAKEIQTLKSAQSNSKESTDE